MVDMKQKTISLLIAVMTVISNAYADSWEFPAEKTEDEFKFGDVTILRTLDARKDQQHPAFYLSIYREDNLEAKFKGVYFEDIYASDDNQHFIGLSNDGLPGTAFVLFDGRGNLIRIQNHEYPLFDYCEMSVTRSRKWYAESPAAEFKYKTVYGVQYLDSVEFTDCHGERKSIKQYLAEGYKRMALLSSQAADVD